MEKRIVEGRADWRRLVVVSKKARGNREEGSSGEVQIDLRYR